MKDTTQQRPSDQNSPNGGRVNDSIEVGDDLEIVNAAAEDRGAGQSVGKPERAQAVLGRGRSVIVVGHEQTLETWISTVQLALAKARRAKTYGLTLDSFLKMLRDMSQG